MDDCNCVLPEQSCEACRKRARLTYGKGYEMDKSCSVWMCQRPYYAKGYCITHYRALKRYGSAYGKHAELNKEREDIIKMAISLAEKVSILDLESTSCPFCHTSTEHKKDCAINDAKKILESSLKFVK